MDEKKALVEAALFLSDEPLTTEELADVMNLGSKGFVQNVVEELEEELSRDDRGLTLVDHDGAYELVVKNDHVDEVAHLAPHRDLNDGELRTLALIAYNQPVKQSEIIDVRGNRAYSHVKELTRRGFVAGEKDGRTKILEVTDHFLDYFELDRPDDFARQQDEGGEDVPW